MSDEKVDADPVRVSAQYQAFYLVSEIWGGCSCGDDAALDFDAVIRVDETDCQCGYDGWIVHIADLLVAAWESGRDGLNNVYCDHSD